VEIGAASRDSCTASLQNCLAFEDPESRLELSAMIMARSNAAPWVRNDHPGFEVMLGDMATFSLPEDSAAAARPLFAV
jgi:hypothetical protein